MKRELGHFMIGASYGGNQEWFKTFMMRIGGCAAETACDSSLYFALHRGVRGIYPFDLDHLTRRDYVDFGHLMEKYLWPRMTGVNRLDIFVKGYAKYLSHRNITEISMDTLSGSEPYEKAAETVISQIDAGYPIPTLVLNHYHKAMKGYEEREETLMVKAVTYSGYEWLDLRVLWDSGWKNRGGFVLYRQEQ